MDHARRIFFKNVLFGSAVFMLSPTTWADRRRGTGKNSPNNELSLVTPGQGMAASVNYVHKNTDIKDVKLKIARQGVPFEKQVCSNCILYAKEGSRNGEEVGKCQLFANQVVKAAGWCTSWAKKA